MAHCGTTPRSYQTARRANFIGMQTRKTIPYGRQSIIEEDIKAVVDVLNSDFLTQGPKIGEFENVFARYIGCDHAVAVANGTAALHLSALALDVKPGTNVITTPITFAASANCIRYCGGNVYFADIDPVSYTLDIEKVRTLIESKPKNFFSGIISVDFAGYAVDLAAFRQLADEHSLWIIEDACHAPGGFFRDAGGNEQRCGNGKFADLTVFSFHPVKHIAMGEGGMITTNNDTLFAKLNLLRTHGITKDKNNFTNSVQLATGDANATEYPAWYMEMQELGYNYRLTDFQAALGITQLKRADAGLGRRRAIAARYDDAFRNHPAILSQSSVVEGHAYHLYVIEVNDRLGLFQHLRNNHIAPQIHYIPTHLMPYYKQLGWKKNDMPLAESYYKHCLSIPMFATLQDNELDFVIEQILAFVGNK